MSGHSTASALCFIDSNIWLYAFIETQDPDKSAKAKDLIRHSDVILSSQIINEVCVNLIKKAHMGEPDVRRLVGSFYAKYRIALIDESVILKSSELREALSLSFWDSLVLSSALLGGAQILYSEDMGHGTVVESRLKVVNPFA